MGWPALRGFCVKMVINLVINGLINPIYMKGFEGYGMRMDETNLNLLPILGTPDLVDV